MPALLNSNPANLSFLRTPIVKRNVCNILVSVVIWIVAEIWQNPGAD